MVCVVLASIPYLVVVHVSGDRRYLYRLRPTEYVLSENGDRIIPETLCFK
jgi:hypothetical protein